MIPIRIPLVGIHAPWIVVFCLYAALLVMAAVEIALLTQRLVERWRGREHAR